MAGQMYPMFKKRHPKVGARPGTLVIPEGAPPPVITMTNYGSVGDAREETVDRVAQLEEAFVEGQVTWIDVQGFGDRTLLTQIGKLFDFHPLLLEDVVNVPQRAKSESYSDQLLLIVKMVTIDAASMIELEQVSITVGKNYVITFQEHPGDVLDPVRKRIRLGKGPIRQHGSDYLAYAIADTIIDAYYPALEIIGERLGELEDAVISHPSPKLLQELNQLKNRLVNLRRAIWPQREAINSLVRDSNALVTDEVRIFLRDTYDHCVQTSEVIEMYREMLTGMMNTYLSSVANRTNDVMKVLTVVATIFIPLTFMAGIYGMNFDHMPELHASWGYPLIWTVMVTTAVGMLLFFRRKGWFGG